MSYIHSEMIMISAVLETKPFFFFSLYIFKVSILSILNYIYKAALIMTYFAAPEILTKVRGFIPISISMSGEEMMNIQFSVHCFS